MSIRLILGFISVKQVRIAVLERICDCIAKVVRDCCFCICVIAGSCETKIGAYRIRKHKDRIIMMEQVGSQRVITNCRICQIKKCPIIQLNCSLSSSDAVRNAFHVHLIVKVHEKLVFGQLYRRHPSHPPHTK